MLQRLFREDCGFGIIIILIFMEGSHSLPSERTGGGRWSVCKKNEDCDKTRFLECEGERCGCRADSGWIWVPEEHICMIKESSHCKMNGMESIDGRCVPNSSCYQGICECDNHYLRNGLGHCERSWGMNCSNNEPCSKRYSLHCPQNESRSQRKCECLDEGKTYVWDVDKQKCVSLAGGACDLENNQGFVKDDKLECILNSRCVNGRNGSGVCQCLSGFTQTAEGNCFAQFGKPCDSNYPSMGVYCNKNEGLVCSSVGICSCPFPDSMRYDQEAHQCRVLVGEGCSTNQGALIGGQSLARNDMIRNCVTNAFCKPRPGSTKGICTCLEGLEKTPDLMCTKFKGHGQPCSSLMDCDGDRFMECAFNINQGQTGTCECFHKLMKWDGKQCRVLPGQSCLKNLVCYDVNSYCDGDWCVCNAFQGYQIDPVKSECIQDTRDIQEISYSTGDSSQDHTPSACDLYSEETLQRKKCECELNPSSHIWGEQESSCLALVGTSCKMDSDCIPHATCDIHENICRCSPSALNTTALQCVLLNVSLSSSSSKKQFTHVPHNHESKPPLFNYDCPESQTLKSIRAVEDDGEAHANAGDTTRLGGVYLISLPPLVSVIISQLVSIVHSRIK